jgi:hypothetical protein
MNLNYRTFAWKYQVMNWIILHFPRAIDWDRESVPFSLAVLPNSRQTHNADLCCTVHRLSVLSRDPYNLYQPTEQLIFVICGLLYE